MNAMTHKGTMKEQEDRINIASCLAGQRLTPQRVLLIELLRQGEHLNAEELYLRAKKQEPRLSLSTVYRNLQVFTRLGLVEEHHFPGVSSCYEIKNGTPHDHLKCLGCGKIVDFECSLSRKTKQNIKNRTRFHITGTRILVEGYCSDCFRHKEAPEEVRDCVH
jgi:Fe2+ or Zn2+ uptake regulation protein